EIVGLIVRRGGDEAPTVHSAQHAADVARTANAAHTTGLLPHAEQVAAAIQFFRRHGAKRVANLAHEIRRRRLEQRNRIGGQGHAVPTVAAPIYDQGAGTRLETDLL